jgi:hypothetical protein
MIGRIGMIVRGVSMNVGIGACDRIVSRAEWHKYPAIEHDWRNALRECYGHECIFCNDQFDLLIIFSTKDSFY